MQSKELNGQIYQILKSHSQRTSNYTQLNTLITNSFSSPQLLNLSFKQYYNKKVTQLQSNINFPSLEMFYNDMLTNATKLTNGFAPIIELLFKGIEGEAENGGVKKECNKEGGGVEYAGMRFVAIVLFCPVIYEGEEKGMFEGLARLVGALGNEQREGLAQWIRGMRKEKFEEIVGYAQMVLSQYTSSEATKNSDPKQLPNLMNNCCRFLSVLHRSNLLTPRTPSSLFHNPTLMTHLPPPTQYNLSKPPPLPLLSYPFLLNASYKLQILHLQNQQQQSLKMQQSLLYLIQQAEQEEEYLDVDPSELEELHLTVKVERENIVGDMKEQVMESQNLKNPLKVEFVGEHGVDDGGIKKECLQLVVRELMGLERGVVCGKNGDKYYWFNGGNEDMEMYEFMGVVVGLALYNDVMLDLKFPLLLYKKLLLPQTETLTSIEDLAEIQPDFYKTFKYLLETNESLESMELCFTADHIVMGTRTSIPLTHKGDLIRVTHHNKHEYIELYLRYLIDKQTAPQFNAFKSGFFKVVTKSSISLFEPHELQIVICGIETLDFGELQKAAKYEGYSPTSPVVTWLWEILETLEQENRKAFLFFVTGSDRAPIGGLGMLAFTVQRHGGDTENVLSAHTCSNVLLLPEYGSKGKLEKKLGVALSHHQGFGLM